MRKSAFVLSSLFLLSGLCLAVWVHHGVWPGLGITAVVLGLSALIIIIATDPREDKHGRTLQEVRQARANFLKEFTAELGILDVRISRANGQWVLYVNLQDRSQKGRLPVEFQGIACRMENEYDGDSKGPFDFILPG